MSLPVLFISHGAPNLYLTPHLPVFGFLNNLAKPSPHESFHIPKHKVKSILVISAHWMEEFPQVNTASIPEQIYDFYGFEEQCYASKYAARGDLGLSNRVM
jgi:aromatic ring-opening dioxygenase catalytic subunit (LigB family)